MSRLLTLALSAALLSGAGCSIDPPTQVDPDDKTGKIPVVQPVDSGNSWTFLVYMVADNNLEPFALQDLNEMMAVGSTDQLKIVVQADRAAGFTQDGIANMPDWQSTKRLEVHPGSLVEVADVGELNMGDPAVLADFVEWGVKTYPADRYALIFWDHGGAWPGFGGDDSTTNHDLLDLAELAGGLQEGIQRAGIGQTGFSLIGYDACLMATVETAFTMQPYGQFLLASEELEPGHGWNYEALAVLAGNPSADAQQLGSAIIDGFVKQAQASGTDKDITLSLVDLVAMGDVMTALDGLAAEMKAASTDAAQAIGTARAQVTEYGAVPQQPEYSTQMIDLGHLASLLASQDGRFQATASAVNAALAKVVVTQKTGPVTSASTGLSIYFPPQAAYYKATYGQVVGVDGWRSFLDTWLAVGGGPGPGPGPEPGPEPDPIPLFASPQSPAPDGIVMVDGQYVVAAPLAQGAASSIVDAVTYAAIVDGDVAISVAEVPAYWDQNEAFGVWDGSALVVSQGANQAYAYMALTTAPDGSLTLDVPFVITGFGGAQEQLVLLHLIMDAQGSQILGETFYLFADGLVSEVAPQPGAMLYPVMPLYDLTTEQSWLEATTDQPFDMTQLIDFEKMLLPDQMPIFMELDVFDHAGNFDFTYGVGVTGGQTIEPPPNGCNGIDFVGACDGSTLMYCEAETELVVYDCPCGCGYDEWNGYMNCFPCDDGSGGY